jgi:hypothetical protein
MFATGKYAMLRPFPMLRAGAVVVLTAGPGGKRAI